VGEGRVLVAGIGNIFLGDDGFGVEVAQRLASVPMPEGVKVADFGIRSMHLAFELLDGYDTLVLIDTVGLGGDPPGTLAIIEPEIESLEGTPMDAHTMNPETVLATLHELGGNVERLLLVGCQPATLAEGIGLSPQVAAVVDEAVGVVRELVDDLVDVLERRSG
jgi:hydrogenase maturation protease